MRVFQSDIITKLTKVSSTIASLGAGSVVKLGGQSYNVGALSVNTSINGVGGIDGLLVANTEYDVYVVLSLGSINLIASIGEPSGYASFVYVGLIWSNFDATDITVLSYDASKDGVIKCQTKTLATDHTTVSVVSELGFSNLTVGKRYKISGGFYIQETSGGNILRELEIRFINNAVVLGRIGSRVDLQQFVRETRYMRRTFIAQATTVTTDKTLSAGVRLLAGRSHVELCEVPDNYIETAEF